MRKKRKKRIVWLAVLIFLLFLASGPLWLFSNIEDKLKAEASALDYQSSLDSAQIDFIGRNCYLTVPADIDKDIAESAAQEINDIQGVRNVKIIYDESLAVKGNEEEQKEQLPGKFTLKWTKDEKNIEGNLDESSADKLEEIFGVSGIDIDTDYTLSSGVVDTLTTIGKDLFSSMDAGTLEVDGDRISISGDVSQTADIDDLISNWGSLSGVELDLKSNATESDEDTTEQIQSEIDEILEFETIEFDKNAHFIKKSSIEIIDSIASILKENEDVDVEIIGHADSYGDDTWNMTLSELRADAVMNALVEKGIDPSRMTAKGMGETTPLDTNSTQEGRQKNRRVEIIVKEND